MDRFDIIERWTKTVCEYADQNPKCDIYSDYIILENPKDKEKAIERLRRQIAEVEKQLDMHMTEKVIMVLEGGKYMLVGYTTKRKKGDNHGKTYKKNCTSKETI